MSSHKILGEVLHYCTKCKLNLNHMITLMKDGQPVRVLCLTCKTQRHYQAPKTQRRRMPGTLPVRTSPKARQLQSESEWRLKLSDKNKTPKAYQIDAAYEQDQHVSHPVFGLGLVVDFIHPDKVHIFFDDGMKILKGRKYKAGQSVGKKIPGSQG